ncbi:MAG: S41 family peptidase [Chitinophagaceae bacterium]|nr:S41 family peptidase [Chitinophagaceae bacterium]
MKTQLTIMAFISMTLFSCQKMLLEPEVENNPVANFEELWKGYDEWYGLFDVKEIDWQEIYAIYKPQVNANTTEAELKDIFHSMIDPLNDNHVFIITTANEPRIESGIFDTLKVQTDFSLDVVRTNYIPELIHYGASIDYGTLPGNIGYVHLGDFTPSQKFYGEAMDKILDELKNTEGMVLDIRDNPGGNDATAQAVAGRFASQQQIYMTVSKKSGPAHDDFTEPFSWYVTPAGESQYTKPVVLLTSRWTQSAGETFALAMQQLSNVKQLGDYTSGAFSDNIARELPNGWYYFVSIGDYRDASGNSLEGIGVEPDMKIVNTKEETLSGVDKALEKAVKLL